jgi:hypothetical protein
MSVSQSQAESAPKYRSTSPSYRLGTRGHFKAIRFETPKRNCRGTLYTVGVIPSSTSHFFFFLRLSMLMIIMRQHSESPITDGKIRTSEVDRLRCSRLFQVTEFRQACAMIAQTCRKLVRSASFASLLESSANTKNACLQGSSLELLSLMWRMHGTFAGRAIAHLAVSEPAAVCTFPDVVWGLRPWQKFSSHVQTCFGV